MQTCLHTVCMVVVEQIVAVIEQIKIMNNINIGLLVGVLLEEEDDRNYMRLFRRNIRDHVNTFEVPDTHFRQLFRLDKPSTLDLIASLNQRILNPSGNIPLHLKVLATLHFLATGSYQNPVGCNALIGLSQPAISKLLNEICRSITTHLLPEWVKFPTTLEDKTAIKQGFYEKWGGRGVLGTIDGTHVDIIAPPTTDVEHPPFVYINRKGKHSINVMLICDSTNKITGCSARFPGSVHDAAIWQVSNIRQYLKQQYENGDTTSHLLGDSGYPLEPWLFTPFHNAADGTPEGRFNMELNSTRNVIERTNGILKGRFRCMSWHRVLNYHPVKAANIIYTCCVLHNIATHRRLPIIENEIEYADIGHAQNDEPVMEYEVLHQGRHERDVYIRQNIV